MGFNGARRGDAADEEAPVENVESFIDVSFLLDKLLAESTLLALN